VQADQVLARLWPSVIVCGRVRARVPSAISAGRSGLGLRGHTGLRQRVENNVHRIEGTALGPVGLHRRQEFTRELAGSRAAVSGARSSAGTGVGIGRRGLRMMMVVVMPANRLRQILDIGQLAALRGVRKVGGELVELGCGRRVTVRLGSRGGACSGSWRFAR